MAVAADGSSNRSDVIGALFDEVGAANGFIERLRALLRVEENGLRQDPRVVAVELPVEGCFAMFEPDANKEVSLYCSECSQAEHREILQVLQDFATRAYADVEPYYFGDTHSSLIALNARTDTTPPADEIG